MSLNVNKFVRNTTNHYNENNVSRRKNLAWKRMVISWPSQNKNKIQWTKELKFFCALKLILINFSVTLCQVTNLSMFLLQTKIDTQFFKKTQTIEKLFISILIFTLICLTPFLRDSIHNHINTLLRIC